MLIDQNVSFKSPRGFVVLEGVNGAGKTSLQLEVVKYLEIQGLTPLSTFEPGATEAGQALRKILLQGKRQPLAPMSEVFLFCADRCEHVAAVIEPALRQKRFVVSDRYYYSTIAFQGYGRKLDIKVLESLNMTAISGLLPDLVVLLDLDPIEGLRRNRLKAGTAKDNTGDAFEQEELAFHERLRQGFLDIARTYKEPFLVIDAGQKPEQVFLETKAVLDKLIAALK